MRALTFGPPVFETPIARIEPEAEILFGVLLYVSASDPRGVARDELCRIIWPSSTGEQGRHSLRQALYRLRQLGVPIHLRAGHVSIDENDTEIDLRELLHGPIDRSELVRIGTQPFLPGYSSQLGSAFREWVEELRDRAAAVRRRALAAAIVDARAQARFGDIHELARALLALDPLNETATLALAEALVMDGSKVDALMLLDRYESEVGEVSDALRIPVRTLRRRVSEGMDDALMPLRFEVPFVGRAREFGELRDVWAGTRRGMGQCALVTGEAGIGKTRTSTELLRLAVLDGGLVVTYTCGAGDTIAPLSSLLGLTGMLLSQPGALGCGQEHLHYLRRLLHPDPQQPLSSGMTADLAYAQLVYSLSELVSAIAEEAPLVIFIDDAHRLHQTSWRIFTDVTHRLPERSLMLLMAARQLPEFYATLGITGSDGRVRHVRLPSMAQGDAVAFLERWSERNRVPFTAAEVTRFAATAAGNPFYLGELAAHRGRGGSDDAPPSTIRGLIELQFAGLREHAQRVLLVVSLLGSHATLERVTRVLELTPMEFLSALEELERAGLVLSHSSAIRLRHSTIAEVIQRMASASALTFARIRTAEILEREAHTNRDPDLLATASESWELAGASDRAAEAANTLGELLLSLGLANESSQSHKRAALLASSEKVRRRANLLLLRALYAANRWASLTEELALLTSSADDRVDVELSLYQASADYFYRHIPPDPTVVVAALHADGLPDALRAHAGLLAVAAWDESLGTWPLPVEYARVESVAATSASTEARSLQLILAAIGGDGERVQGLTRRVVSTTRQTNPALGLRELRHAAYALIRVGSSDQAWEPLSAALSDAARLGLTQHEHATLLGLAQIAAHTGRVDRLRRVVERSRELTNPAEPLALRRHIWILSQLAFLDPAEDYSLEASEILRALALRAHPLDGPAERVGLQLFLAPRIQVAEGAEVDAGIEGPLPVVMARGAWDHLALATAKHISLTSGAERARSFWASYTERVRRDRKEPAPEILTCLSELALT